MPEPQTTHDGHTVAALREGRGWTQYRLAKEAGLPEPTVRRAEKDGGVTLRVARALCEALGCSLAVFDRPAGP